LGGNPPPAPRKRGGKGGEGGPGGGGAWATGSPGTGPEPARF